MTELSAAALWFSLGVSGGAVAAILLSLALRWYPVFVIVGNTLVTVVVFYDLEWCEWPFIVSFVHTLAGVLWVFIVAWVYRVCKRLGWIEGGSSAAREGDDGGDHK